MMIVMLTPSLACAMPLCTPAAKVMPCHEGMQAPDTDHKTGPGKVMLVKDCAGIDLHTAQGPSLDAPDLNVLPAFPVPVVTLADAQVLRETARTTTGPAPLPDDARPRPFSLILNERLLI